MVGRGPGPRVGKRMDIGRFLNTVDYRQRGSVWVPLVIGGMFEKNAREGLKYGWALFCFILFELYFPRTFTHILHLMILYNFEFFKFF